MTDTYKATPEQWQATEKRADNGNIIDIRLLELLARIEQLEAQASSYPVTPDSSTPPPVATDEELRQTWLQAATLTQGHRAVYNLGIEHGQASSREVALFNDHEHQWDKESRAAILEVKRRLRARGWGDD